MIKTNKLRREILFRGFPEKGDDWKYGYLTCVKSIVYIVSPIGQQIQVIPNSVGQKTEFKDLRGNDIYENDVLYDPKYKKKWYVSFLEGRWCLSDESCYFPEHIWEWNNFIVIGNNLTNNTKIGSRVSPILIKTMSFDKFKGYCLEQNWIDALPGKNERIEFTKSRVPENIAIIEIGDSYILSEDSIFCQEYDYDGTPIYRNFLKLNFDDIEYPCETYNRANSRVSIDKKQARIIAEFVKSNYQEIDKYIIHCQAGISRSGAIAEFIASFLKERGILHKFRERYTTRPNLLVRELLNEYLYDKN